MIQIVSDLHPVRRLVKVLLRVSHDTDCVRPTSCQTASEGPAVGESWNRLCQTYTVINISIPQMCD